MKNERYFPHMDYFQSWEIFSHWFGTLPLLLQCIYGFIAFGVVAAAYTLIHGLFFTSYK